MTLSRSPAILSGENSASEAGSTPAAKEPFFTSRRLTIVAVVFALWLIARLVGWVGYAGADDQYYARYAHLLHRVPMNHMEFRMPVVLSLRAAMELFGTSETAVCLAPMFYSAMLFAAVAWFVGWPRDLSWRSTGSMLLVSLIPIDVAFATYPSPAALSAGLTALGVVCVLKGRTWVGILGALLLALAFMAHFLNFFFVGIFCLTAFAIDWRRYWLPVAACVLFSGGLLAAEMCTYWFLAGNPTLRFDALSGLSEGIPDDGRSDTKLGFFLMPLQILILSKQFGFGLLLLLICGACSFRKLAPTQRIVWIATIGFWFWLGYGTVTPAGYRPATRGMHYYTPLVFGLCALLPLTLEYFFERRKALGQGLLVLLLLLYTAALALGGSWGRQVDCSKLLLRYAQHHPQERFLTDVHTLNEMYCQNGFQIPPNVVVLDSPTQRKNLLINKEPEGHRAISFSNPEKVDGILINLSRTESPAEDEFTSFLERHRGEVVYRIPPRLRLIFRPLAAWVKDKGFARQNSGAEVRALQ
jgi:hypothetical protein